MRDWRVPGVGLTYINLERLMEILLAELETGKREIKLVPTRSGCPFGSMKLVVKKSGEDDLVSLRCYEARLAEPFVRAFRSGDRKAVERIYSEMLKEQ